MKRIIILLTAISLVLVISSCDMMAGSGTLVESEFLNKDFNSVEASSTCDLTIVKGEEFSIVITCDDNLGQHLIVNESNGVLKIDLQPYTAYNHITFKARVVMPELKSVMVSGASKLSISGFETTDLFTAELSGASSGVLDFVSTADVKTTVSGASGLTFSSDAMTGDLELTCTGASKVEMRNCEAGDVKANVSGASSVWITAGGNLIGSLTGASNLYYGGSPYINGFTVDISSVLKRY